MDTNIQLFFFYCSYSLVGTVSFDMTGQNSNSVSQLASCYIVSPLMMRIMHNVFKQHIRMFLSFIWEMDEHMQLRVVTLLWQWWLERNRVREGERRRSVSELIPNDIVVQCDEFLKI